MSIAKRIKKNINLAEFTTFKIGGRAKFFLEVKSLSDLKSAVKWAKSKSQLIFILAGGSNVLVSDKKINGLVIKLALNKLKVKGEIMFCQAGVYLSQLLKTASQKGLSGPEWAMGIPGTVGGAIRGNAGAFGYQISQSVLKVKVYDILTNKFLILSKAQCHFTYRHSIFKEKKNLIICQIELKFKKAAKEEIQSQLNDYKNYRYRSQPREPSAGCIFQNLTLKQLQQSQPALAKKLETKKIVKAGKIGAGWLIEQSGLKGHRQGGAEISQKHANFIVNTGKTRAGEVIKLINLIKKKVRKKFGVKLKEEIEYFGF